MLETRNGCRMSSALSASRTAVGWSGSLERASYCLNEVYQELFHPLILIQSVNPHKRWKYYPSKKIMDIPHSWTNMIHPPHKKTHPLNQRNIFKHLPTINISIRSFRTERLVRLCSSTNSHFSSWYMIFSPFLRKKATPVNSLLIGKNQTQTKKVPI